MRSDTQLGMLIAKIVGGVVVVGVGIAVVSNSVMTVGSDEIVVKQNLLDGQLQVWNTPGVHWQNFGKITVYRKSQQYWFSSRTDEGKPTDDSIKVRYSDGAHSNISGSLRYNLPLDEKDMILLHSTYGSMAAIDHELIKQVVNKSVFLTGPLMTSRESYAEKRNDLINYITDQVMYGVYKTEHTQTETTDPLTNQKKVVDLVQPKVNPKAPNGFEREEESPLQKYGITASNITINGIEYDEVVEKQIKDQQAAVALVQQAIVNSRKAEQDAITIEKQGEANAAKAKWEQEVVKATEITKAQQDKEVAVLAANKDKEVQQLALETARIAAQKTIAEARAEADAKRLIAISGSTNNNLQDRLEAYILVQKEWAKSFAAQRQTPDIVMGTNASAPPSQLMDMLMIKTAKDLGVNPKP
jgi:regulator of protease activity HflC (stomatin/prohibitin superfamily)